MADEENQEESFETKPSKSKLPIIVIGAVITIALFAVVAIMMMKSEPDVPVESPSAEYVVTAKMYQLKDGSYLRLGFSIVISEDNLTTVQDLIETSAPGRLPNGVTMILGNKTREEMISSRHQREAFARELKKMLEERVFAEFNSRQTSARETIQVREVLISDYVTQSG